ncbi:hypothetical protein ES708_28910 [subsurface metagenome]
MIEGGIENGFHDVGHGQGAAPAVGAPFQLAHEAATHGVHLLHDIAYDEVHGEALVQTEVILVVPELEALFGVAVQPAP